VELNCRRAACTRSASRPAWRRTGVCGCASLPEAKELVIALACVRGSFAQGVRARLRVKRQRFQGRIQYHAAVVNQVAKLFPSYCQQNCDPLFEPKGGHRIDASCSLRRNPNGEEGNCAEKQRRNDESDWIPGFDTK
jgi:hypothetical protein